MGGTPSIFAEAAGTIPAPAATAKANKTKKRPIPMSPPPVGIAVPENLLIHIETLADTAERPDTAQKEREASTAEKGKPKVSSNRRRYLKKNARLRLRQTTSHCWRHPSPRLFSTLSWTVHRLKVHRL